MACAIGSFRTGHVPLSSSDVALAVTYGMITVSMT
jgi:hypothetical protein